MLENVQRFSTKWSKFRKAEYISMSFMLINNDNLQVKQCVYSHSHLEASKYTHTSANASRQLFSVRMLLITKIQQQHDHLMLGYVCMCWWQVLLFFFGVILKLSPIQFFLGTHTHTYMPMCLRSSHSFRGKQNQIQNIAECQSEQSLAIG